MILEGVSKYGKAGERAYPVVQSGSVRKLAMAAIACLVCAGCSKPGEDEAAAGRPARRAGKMTGKAHHGRAGAPQWPEGRFLFHSDETGKNQVYLKAGDKPAVRLTDVANGAVEASWSPDGKRVALAAYAEDPSNLEIVIMGIDGKERRKLTQQQPRLNWRPAWSPDGSRILFQSNRDGNFELYKASVDGKSVVNLTRHPAKDGDADWSPDGNRIVFASQRDGTAYGLYVMNQDGTGVKRLLDESWKCSFPRWSPDGSRIAFTSDKQGLSGICLIGAGGGEVRMVSDQKRNYVMPDWVGNTKLVCSGESAPRRWDLFLLDLETTDLLQLTATPHSERYPAWAP